MSSMLKIGIAAVKWLAALNVVLFGINILQKGGRYKGESVKDILGKDPEKATAEDCLKLSKARFVQLYYAAPCPDMADLRGEYEATNHPGGVLAPGVQIFTNHFFGPGKWVGKAFQPIDSLNGEGYNIFQRMGGDGKPFLTRSRRIDTSIGRSAYDDKNAYHLDYSPYNGGLVHSMHDELRKINDHLFVGLGHMASGGGSINPAPFIVHGAPREWVGC